MCWIPPGVRNDQRLQQRRSSGQEYITKSITMTRFIVFLNTPLHSMCSSPWKLPLAKSSIKSTSSTGYRAMVMQFWWYSRELTPEMQSFMLLTMSDLASWAYSSSSFRIFVSAKPWAAVIRINDGIMPLGTYLRTFVNRKTSIPSTWGQLSISSLSINHHLGFPLLAFKSYSCPFKALDLLVTILPISDILTLIFAI